MPKVTKAETRIRAALNLPAPEVEAMSTMNALEATTTDRLKLLGRLAGIGAECAKCPRCGGTGKLELHRRVKGGTCFKCNGFGKRLPKLTPALADDVEQRVKDGRLAAYWERLRAIEARKKAAQNK